MTGTARTDTQGITRELLAKIGVHDSYSVAALPGGRNNQVYRVRVGAQSYLLKRYFRHPQDPRDRLGQEFDFLEHLQRIGSRRVPAPLAADPENHTGLLEFVEGQRLELRDITADAVDQAAALYADANSVRPLPAHLRPASEACFSISEHVATTQRRVDRLATVVVEDDLDAAAREFSTGQLTPCWARIVRLIETEWPQADQRESRLQPAECCLSPSDFGFHNALRQSDDQIRFLDFEYAGRDDPAKLVCDFANQPDMLLPRELSDRFRIAVLAGASRPEELVRRIVALEPLYQVKWACICLNDFLAAGRTRYRFTDGAAADHSRRRSLQLERARTMLGRAQANL